MILNNIKNVKIYTCSWDALRSNSAKVVMPQGALDIALASESAFKKSYYRVSTFQSQKGPLITLLTRRLEGPYIKEGLITQHSRGLRRFYPPEPLSIQGLANSVQLRAAFRGISVIHNGQPGGLRTPLPTDRFRCFLWGGGICRCCGYY